MEYIHTRCRNVGLQYPVDRSKLTFEKKRHAWSNIFGSEPRVHEPNVSMWERLIYLTLSRNEKQQIENHKSYAKWDNHHHTEIDMRTYVRTWWWSSITNIMIMLRTTALDIDLYINLRSGRKLSVVNV